MTSFKTKSELPTPMRCPDCGAVVEEVGACQKIFESFLVLDYTDPGYGTVHPLTVGCYMIQHNRYSDEALVWMYEKISQFLYKGLTLEQFRQIASPETSNSKRTWKVVRQPGAPALPKIDWQMTIADVAREVADAESYQQWVKEWARATLEQMEANYHLGEQWKGQRKSTRR